jgi:hypothetical protein
MRPLPRRAWRPRATLMAWTGVLATTVGFGPAGASPTSARLAVQGSCPGATVTRQYTAESMTFRLHVDLGGCPWWDGSPRNLVIWLSRDDGTGPADRYTMTACPPDCDVVAALPHQSEEKAVAYQGEATWQWKDGPRRVSFETRCTTTRQGHASCADPVETWHDYD